MCVWAGGSIHRSNGAVGVHVEDDRVGTPCANAVGVRDAAEGAIAGEEVSRGAWRGEHPLLEGVLGRPRGRGVIVEEIGLSRRYLLCGAE